MRIYAYSAHIRILCADTHNIRIYASYAHIRIICAYTDNLERYRVVRRPPFKSGAAVHVEHADPCGQCSSWSMLIRVASAALGAG